MRLGTRRARLAVAGGCVALAVTGVVVAVTRSDGYSARQVDLGDGGVWAVSDRDGLLGRANLPAGSLDTAFAPPGAAAQDYQLDIVQDASAVVARDRANGRVYPVDVSTGAPLTDNGISLGPDGDVALAGGTLAVLDPATGKVRALRYDPKAGLGNLSALTAKAPAVADIRSSGRDEAALAVGADGTIRAVSAGGRLATVRQNESGFASASYRRVARLRSPQVTSVGATGVTFDAGTGALRFDGGRQVTLPEKDVNARLQQPGAGTGRVLVATRTTLYGIDVDGGRVRRLSSAGTGTPAAPVTVGSCGYVAWVGNPGRVVRSCPGKAAGAVRLEGDTTALVQPQVQVNRGAAVLNDVVSGAVWDLRTGQRVDNWAEVKPPPKVKPKPDRNKPDTKVGTVSAPPRAVADDLGARPGRTATLHVLDNDSDPAGRILSVTRVYGLDDRDADLEVAPDGQSVQVRMPASGGAVHFRYTVDDGNDLSSNAPVTVTPRPAGVNRAPNLRTGFKTRTWPVAAGGRLSLPVIGDWRDYDGDPPVLSDARVTAGSVSTTPDGRLDLVAPLRAGPQTITYSVTDGVATRRATVAVEVRGVTSARTTSAIANPDVARGQAGQPIVVRPLDNDLPGADPTDPNATLALAADIAEPDGTTVDTDVAAGTVTLTAARAGTFTFSYTVAYGNAAYAKGNVRVDVTPAAGRTEPPVAVLDTATLHGQRPGIADVLTNDFDPAGRLLVVTAAHADDAEQLEVAIVQGRYLRIRALQPKISPDPQVIDYVITDGVSSSASGQVVVNQLPEPAHDTPVPHDDFATVRAGDSVTAPVLDNDSDPGGDTLTLAPQVQDAPAAGRLVVNSRSGGHGGGAAYVSGGVVRYAAPASVQRPTEVTIDYVARNGDGDQAVGHLYVTVEPAPAKDRPNRAPAPPEVDGRAVAGDTVTIPIRTSGVDPDGDAVTLVGPGSGPKLGRVLGTTPAALTYQAYPTSGGTDTFDYVVTDRYGKTAEGTVRVAVVSPGDPQPPVASDIAVTAAPGARVSVDVLDHAFVATGDRVSVLPLARTNGARIPGAARLVARAATVEVTAPSGAAPAVVRYGIENGLGTTSYASLTVRSEQDTNLPPVAADDIARPRPNADLVTVDPLARASDPDHTSGPLTVSRVFAAGARVSDGRITLRVTGRPQVVPYEIRDGAGGAALAVVFVPPVGDGAPQTRPDRVITVPRNGTKTIDIASYAIDPAGKPLVLTTATELSASPSPGLRAAADGPTRLTLTAARNYVGPAAVTFGVTNGRSVTDPRGTRAVITVPVQVGPQTPVLRCPTNRLPVLEGGGPVELDISTLCHVWVANPRTLDDIQYTASWSPAPGDVTLDGVGSRSLRVSASGAAKPGSAGTLRIGVAGSSAQPDELHVVVAAAPRPRLAPARVDGVIAGRTASVDLANYLDSPLRDRSVAVVSTGQLSGLRSTSTRNGSRITITPDPDAHGTIVYAVTVTDRADVRDRTDRQTTGRVTLHVLGRPDPPTGVSPGRTVLSHSATLSWNTPANNGLPIDYYDVSWGSGRHRCQASPCAIPGLTNGRPYRFTVRAHNRVGFGKPSASSPSVVPDAVPDAPTGLVVSDPTDGRVRVSWREARVDGTPVLHYLLSWPGHQRTVDGLSAVASGLDNDAATRFQVRAVNRKGVGDAGSVRGQSSGVPQYPSPPAQPQRLPAPRLDPTSQGDNQSVTITWPAIDPNGPGPTRYTVTRTRQGNGGTRVCVDVTMRRCTDPDVPNDGAQYTYTYTAANATPGHRSADSQPNSFVARGVPGGIGRLQANGNGTDGEAELVFDVRPVFDTGSTVTCYVGAVGGTRCGSWEFDGPAGHPGQHRKATGLPDGPVTIVLQQTNSVGKPGATDSARTVVYGKLEQPQIVDAHTSGPNVDFIARWKNHGARVRVRVQVSVAGRTIYDDTSIPDDADDAVHEYRFTDASGPRPGTPIRIQSKTSATITVTLTDASQFRRNPPGQASAIVTSGPITVAVSAGRRCKPQKACRSVHLQLSGFQRSGSVSCTFSTTRSPSIKAITVRTDGAGGYNKDLSRKYYTARGRVTATCDGIRSSASSPWPSK